MSRGSIRRMNEPQAGDLVEIEVSAERVLALVLEVWRKHRRDPLTMKLWRVDSMCVVEAYKPSSFVVVKVLSSPK